MTQQQQKKQEHRAGHRTVAEWVVIVLNLGLGIGVSLLHPRLPFPGWHEMMMFQWGIFLAFIGYWGAGLTLLLNVRRIAALFQFLCALAWWCLIAHATTRFPDGTYHPTTWTLCGALFLIGLVHALLARWLWRQERAEEK